MLPNCLKKTRKTVHRKLHVKKFFSHHTLFDDNNKKQVYCSKMHPTMSTENF